jgi:hypothetical protein
LGIIEGFEQCVTFEGKSKKLKKKSENAIFVAKKEQKIKLLILAKNAKF